MKLTKTLLLSALLVFACSVSHGEAKAPAPVQGHECIVTMVTDAIPTVKVEVAVNGIQNYADSNFSYLIEADREAVINPVPIACYQTRPVETPQKLQLLPGSVIHSPADVHLLAYEKYTVPIRVYLTQPWFVNYFRNIG